MIWHHNKLMQIVFPFFSVAEQDFNKEVGNFLNLKEAFLFENVCGDEIG